MSGAAYQINGAPVSREAFYALACDPARSIAVEAWLRIYDFASAVVSGQ